MLQSVQVTESRVMATISPTEGIRVDKDNGRNSVMVSNSPQFMKNQKSVLDELDNFNVLTEWGSRKIFDVQGRSWAFTGSQLLLKMHFKATSKNHIK